MWEIFFDIRDVPQWDDLVSRGDVCLDRRLIRSAVEQGRCLFFKKCIDGQVAAMFMVCTGGDGVAQTGTDETSGAHFWYDPQYFSEQSFLKEASAEFFQRYPDAKTLVFRDFIGHEPTSEVGVAQRNLDVTTLDISPDVNTLDEHIATLKYKYRYQIAQYRAAVADERFTSECVSDFLSILDEIYPLYTDVCSRATEYVAPPHPKSFFEKIKKNFRDDAVVVVVREFGVIVGFMLLLYTSESCVHQYIGFRRRAELFLWHNLTLASIADALRRGVRHINMGVTNASAKHKFGGVSAPAFQLSVRNGL